MLVGRAFSAAKLLPVAKAALRPELQRLADSIHEAQVAPLQDRCQ